MSYGPDPHFALSDFEQAVEDRKVLGVAFVGSDGTTRVWLHNDVVSVEEHAWVSERFAQAVTLALTMQDGASRA